MSDKIYRKDLVNQTFSNLKVLTYNNNTKKWVCQCKCGGVIEVETKNLTSNRVKSCGCMKYVRKNNIDTNKNYKKLFQIYKDIKHYNLKRYSKIINWDDFEDFKQWSLNNGYMEQLSYKKTAKGEPYSKENLIFGIKYNGKFLPIKEAKDWKIYYNQKDNDFLIRFRYNKATVKQEHIKTIPELCKTHIKLYKRYFHKKSCFE